MKNQMKDFGGDKMNLKPLISPKNVALVGASNKSGSLGHDMVKMIKSGGYEGGIYPINPRYDEVCGIKCYPDIKSIGKDIDVAVLCVAAKRVEEQIDIAIENGVRSLVIFANCVLEDDIVPSLEERIIKKCKEADIPVLGHNAMGFYNNDLNLRICGFEAPDEGVKGNIALVSQSGSVFSTIGHNEPQLKFNMMVATGTGQVTSLSDYMIYALNMETTKVLGVYMESVRKPERFIEALRLAAQKKIPVVAMKVGKSKLGAAFAKSHTGGLAGDDDAIQAVFDHYGVIRVDSLGEMANTLALFSYYPTAPNGGIVAIADSGGERNLLADDAETVGIGFAKLSEKTMEELEEIQEFGQHADNPLDPWGTGIDFEEIFADSLTLMLKDDNAAIGVISQDLRDGYYLSQGCIDALRIGKENTGKPVAFITNFGGTRRAEYTKQINDFGAPVLMETQPALKAIKNYLKFRDFKYESSKLEKLSLSTEAISLLENNEVLKEAESMKIFKELNFPINDAYIVNSLEELESVRDAIKYPVVVKTAVDGILHKADVGGVKLNITSYEELKDAYVDMRRRLGKEVMVAPMVSFEVEIILGMKLDPTFGPLVVVGAGGIFTELLKDRIVLLPTASEGEIIRGLETLKTYKLFCGFRGKKSVDMDKLVAEIKKFCGICNYLSKWVKEIDINPLGIDGDNMVALDSLILCK